MTILTPEGLAAIKERLAKATPGPWTNLDTSSSCGGWDSAANGRLIRSSEHTTEEAVVGFNNYDASPRMLLEDREFIAHAREDIPNLIETVEADQKVIAGLNALCAERFEQINYLHSQLEAQTKRIAELEEMSGWLPAAENVNALPESLRHYVMLLETRCDLSGDTADLVITRDQNQMLAAKIGELKRAACRLAYVVKDASKDTNMEIDDDIIELADQAILQSPPSDKGEG